MNMEIAAANERDVCANFDFMFLQDVGGFDSGLLSNGRAYFYLRQAREEWQ